MKNDVVNFYLKFKEPLVHKFPIIFAYQDSIT